MRVSTGLASWGLATVLLLGSACPAGACSCAPAGEQEAWEHADVVFTGTVTERVDTQAGQEVVNTGGPVVHTLSVERVEKGQLGSRVEVTSALSEASCGFRFHVGSRYRVFAWHGPGGLTTGLCSGTAFVDIPPREAASPDPIPDPASADSMPGEGLVALGLLGLVLLGLTTHLRRGPALRR